MRVFAHTRLTILCHDLSCRAKTQLTSIFYTNDAHLQPTFLFDRFKCLMLFTNVHFSSIIQHSCVWRTNAIVARELFRSLRLTSIAFV